MINNSLSYISPKAIVKSSAIQGRGLFAGEDIGQGEIVAIKGGHIFNRTVLKQLQPILGAAEIQIGSDHFIGPLIEADREGCMIFSNHSCSPNIGVQGQIVFVAMRDIVAGEELTHDWAMTDDDDDEMECKCQSTECRKIVTGKDWTKPELQKKYAGYFSWYLAEKM